MEARSFATVGAVTRRKDGLAKVTGTEVYPSDMYLPYALHARVLRSPHPHARIVSIDTREAEKMGAICITALSPVNRRVSSWSSRRIGSSGVRCDDR